MLAIAASALADINVGDKPGFARFIRKDPLGVVLVIAAWNYPVRLRRWAAPPHLYAISPARAPRPAPLQYLIAVNSVVPAILAGNAVLLKHAAQTPLVAERLAEAFKAAGLPSGVFQVLHMSHRTTELAIQHPAVSFVNFTGSVRGGHEIVRAACSRFIGCGLELGGKDPAYVRADADLEHAVANLVDGAFYNAGQCCCAIERIYVHASIFDAFVARFVDEVKRYRLGNPLDPSTNLGPMVSTAAAEWVRKQIRDAVAAGAKALIDTSLFPADQPGTPYLAPQVLVNVDHKMSVMWEESFGPVIGIMPVDGDDEAIRLMNDSPYGLTASVWTRDYDTAIRLGDQVETGTFYVNRCDYLDPALAWTGVKDSGRGCTLSVLGFDQLTRPKSFYVRKLSP